MINVLSARRFFCLFAITSLMFCSLMANVYGLTLKMGVIAPKGTNWANNLDDMAKEIKKATNGRVKFKVYYGATAGDEPVALRKIHIGQLHGGIFTGKTLGEIYGDSRIIELPFSFGRDRAAAWKTLLSVKDYINKGFTKNGFKNLGFFEIGLVYAVTTKEVKNLKELKSIKLWSWEGDQVVSTFVKTLELVSVPLALPDVLSSLSTGIVEAAYSPPLGILALQWHTTVKYLIDFPIGFSMGAFLIGQKSWKKVSPADQKLVQQIADKYIAKANKSTIVENNDALNTLKQIGVKFIEFPAEEITRGKEVNVEVLRRLYYDHKFFSKKAVQLLSNSNKEFKKLYKNFFKARTSATTSKKKLSSSLVN